MKTRYFVRFDEKDPDTVYYYLVVPDKGEVMGFNPKSRGREWRSSFTLKTVIECGIFKEINEEELALLLSL